MPVPPATMPMERFMLGLYASLMMGPLTSNVSPICVHNCVKVLLTSTFVGMMYAPSDVDVP